MAKLKEGFLGGFSGILGTAVGSSWKGKAVIRSRPPRKRRKSSELQLRQMAKLKLLIPFVKPITNFLNMTYSSVTENMSCFNKAMSYNLRNAISGEYPDFRINYPRVVLGVGDLLNPDTISVHSDSEGRLSFSWTDNSGEGSARATDRAFVAIYCADLEDWITETASPRRNAGGYTLDVAAFSGKTVQAYMGFLSADADFVSTSRYAGELYIL
jgi:hypothetical protein